MLQRDADNYIDASGVQVIRFFGSGELPPPTYGAVDDGTSP